MDAGRGVRWTVRAGLLAGIVAVYLCLVGLVGTLTTFVVGRISVGRVFLALPAVLVGYLVARPVMTSGTVRRLSVRSGVTVGTLAGGTAGVVLAAGVGVVNLIGQATVRSVFIAVSPQLMNILTFGQSALVGALALIVLGAGLGAIGGGVSAAPDHVKRPTIVASATVVTLGPARTSG
jgi:hypothetical protein